MSVTRSSLRKSTRVRRLSSKAMDHLNDGVDVRLTKVQNINNDKIDDDVEPVLKKRKFATVPTAVISGATKAMSASSNANVNNYELINLKMSEEDDEMMLFNNQSDGLFDHDQFSTSFENDLRETELRISQLTSSSASSSPLSEPVTPSISSEPEQSTPLQHTSLEEFLQYDLMTDEDDGSESSSSSSSPNTPNSPSSIQFDYLPQCFDYRLSSDSINLSLNLDALQLRKSASSSMVDNSTTGVLLNAIKKRATDCFLADGIFNRFV